jgi:hypothetical protein
MLGRRGWRRIALQVCLLILQPFLFSVRSEMP